MSLLGYYPLDVGTNSGTNIANITTGSNIYDASLNGGAYISTSNYRIGKGALSLDISGQYVKINNSLTTNNSGLTFAFWARANNLCGQYTLLDYSNGTGGNNKIILGIQNNTLYGQVVNGTGLNALTNFSASATFTTVGTTGCHGMCMTSDGQRIIYCDYDNGNIYTYLLISGTWTLKDTLSVGSSPIGVCCTADGSRLVISRRLGVLQWATWNGSGYTGLTTTGLSGNPDGGPSMTPDGRILIVSRGNSNGPNTVVYSFWTGTNYTTFNNVSSTSQKWIHSAITPDGSRVAYVSYNTTQTAYVSFWNATTQSYGNETALTTLNGPPTSVCFSKDGNIIIVGIQNATASTGYQYAIWNGTAYSSLVSFPSGSIPANYICVGAVLGWDNGYYTLAYGSNLLLKTSYTVSNQYSLTNFYSAQNLNDNAWRHYAWTIDTPNNTYKYYINGNLIKTDISSGYAYPAATTRTINLLGTSTDLSMSYMTGGIDSYRVYSGALTDAQVVTLFKAEAYNGQLQIQNYTFDTPAFSSNNVGNYVSGSYIYDASLNAYGGANLVQNGNIDSGITGWTTSGNVGYTSFGTSYRKDTVPSSINSFIYPYYNGSYIAQTITFPKAGNYSLSFWATINSSLTDTLILNVGSILTKTITFNNLVWSQYSFSFYLDSTQLSQQLKFTINGTTFLWITGVVVQNTDNYTLTTSFRNNQGSLSLDNSGQTVKMNAPFTTTSSGLSITFWARANNGYGQYTLLDYSNGTAGNQKITYGIQNNTIYAQTINGTSIGTVSVANAVSTLSGLTVRNDAENFCVSADVKRIIVWGTSGTFTAYNYNGSSWGSSAVGSVTGTGLCCTADGSRLVVSSGTSPIVYFWDGSQYSGATTTGLGLSSNGLAMTPDGRVLVVAKGHGSTASYVYYSFWNSTANNYTTFVQVPCTAKRWKEVDITPDGTRISYTSYQDSVSYYSIWNDGSKTFGNEAQFTTTGAVINGVMRFSKDGNIAFSMGRDNRTLQYAIWNGTSYSQMTVAATSTTLGDYTGLFVGWDNILYFSFWSNTSIIKLPFSVSNQYSISNFYSTQNLNDNQWRHYAWTIDPSNTTYKYYLNGSLIKTDASSGYAFPQPTTRTNNLLGTSTDLPLSYFVGGIANYQTYNGVYSDTQVLALYKADTYGTQTPVTYYTCDTSTVSNNQMTNLVSNTADAFLMGGAAITSTNYKTGITSTGYGQYVQINSSLTTTTTSSGLTFSFWLKSQNGSGINPLLDYSKGQGNNRVALSLWNGSPYAQVISDVSLGTITLTNDAGFSKTCTGNVFGITLSANHQRMAIITTTGVYYATYSAGTWSAFTAIVTATITGGGIAMSSDGYQLVWNQKTAYTYFSVWNSTTSTYGTATQTLDTNYRTFTNLHMTADGSRIVACGGYEPAVLYANWNGSNYSAFTSTPAIPNTIYLSGTTNTSGTWGTPTAGNVFTTAVTKPETYYVWSTANSATTAFWSDDTRPIIFEYNYNNTTGSSISATMYYIIDNYMWFYFNGVQTGGGSALSAGFPNGNTLSLTLPTGNNRFQFACINNPSAGPAALAVIVKSNTGDLLFNTNATNSGWTLTNPYCGLAITPDGNRIFYGIQVLTGNQTTTNSLYYADWNSTKNNYNSGTLIGVVNNNTANYLRNIRCSPDGNAVFVSSYGTSFVSWYVFNSATSTFISQNSLSLSTNDVYALDTIWDGPNKYLYVGYATSLTRYTYTASNTYTQTNFYTTQNLNDGAWRHFAWTIDPSTTSYKYYLNGVLIKNDTSANYVFPAQTTRTNNLLLTSTDLSLSYFVGTIDNYRVYTGVLTDTQINTLFQTDAYGGQSPTLFQNYTFNQGSNSGVNLVNASTNLYDASLNGGAYISTTNYKSGTGALSLDTSGQYVKMNTALTTTSNTGLTLSFLARCNNGCGQYTLLDYSNGTGGNQKISLGLLNNSPYAQVINGTSIGTVSILTDSFSKSHTNTINGLAFSANHQTMIISATNGVYYSSYSNGTWSAFTTVISATYSLGSDVAITADGSKIVWSINGGNCFFATWNTASQNYISITQTLDVTSRNYLSLGMTADGTRIVTAVSGSGYIYTANWTGTNYTVFTQISDNNLRSYNSIAITTDGSRIYAGSQSGTDNLLYYSVWNSNTGNYGSTILAANVLSGNSNWIRRVKCSSDGNIVFVTSYGGSAGIPQIACYTFNGTGFVSQTPYIYGVSADQWAMTTVVDGSYNYIYIGINTAISRFRYTVSNQYTLTNFYSTQNLNDNAWRHYAWTIDPSNTTYKYYLNGSLIKTDASSGYTFPALTTRSINLLGISTDLSMSYFTGGIDQYRVQTGVLTDAQINTLFQSDTYNNRSLIQYYTFDTSFNSSTSIANLATNSTTGVYDASLNGGAYISTTNYKIGGGALAIDASGQNVRFNTQITTSNTGMSFSFWLRGNSGCGQYTLLDYSNGYGGNNRISLGLQNNTLFGEVINGTSIGSLTFNALTSSATATHITGLAFSTSANRFVWGYYETGYLYFRTGISGSDTVINGTAYTNFIDVCMTNDGNRIVWTSRVGLTYFATWNGSTNYTGIQTVNAEATTRGFQSVDMTEDGGILIATIGAIFGAGSAGVPLWARWNGTNYSAYNTTLNSTSDNYTGAAITPDGSRIAYTTAGKSVYYAVWNGTNYSDRILIGSVLYEFGLKLKFSKDGNILFVSSYRNSDGYGVIQYCIWNGPSMGFGPLMLGITINNASGTFGMTTDYNNNLYYGNYNANTIYKTAITISNQYLQSNFYSAQNLNDNTWRHIAWTIDPSNTTYKYYVSGSLVKTDISSAYTFPSPNTRTNNLLGVATDLSLSYFIGGIDKYRMYSGVLTDAQIAILAGETIPEGTLTTLYPLDITTVNGVNISNNASGSYVYDASLNNGATISTNSYKVGVGSLSLDISGQSLKINKPLTNTTGLSFLFWSKSSNGTGQTTLFDYAGGSGGNQKITYGLQNNQIYAQITNGTTVGTLTFSQAQTTSLSANAIAVAYAPTTNITVYATTTGALYIRNGWAISGQDTVAVSGTYPGINNLFLTSDGNRLVWSIRGGDVYYAQWNGSIFSNPQTINAGTATVQGMDMTDDGSILAIVCGNVFGGMSGAPQWCYWTGSGYSAYKTVLNTGVGDFVSCAITPDGNRITYLDYTTNQLYYAVWNGTNYTPERYALYLNGNGTTMNNTTYYNSFSTGTIECWVKMTDYNNSSRSGIIVKNNNFSLYIWFGGTLCCYDWNGGQIGYGTTAVNDGKWHHIALVYQNGVTNGSQLYVDGKPDGTPFTRNNTGTTTAGISIGAEYGTFLPFYGYIDEMRFWNVALTNTDMLKNYNTRLSKTTSGLTGYWSMDEGSGTTLNEAVSGSQTITLNSQMSWVPRDVMTIPSGCRNLKMSKDGNILFLIYPGTTNVLRYLVWDGTTYGSAITPSALNTTTVFDNTVQCWGLWVDYNNAIYTIDYNNTIVSSVATTTLYKTTFQASNQYTATHFYAQENMNNSVWRQCAWTIDPYTSTYKYYVNGTLVKTDTSSNYVFPSIASRTNNQLGVSTDLSMSYFKGKLDYYRVYNGILTDAQITAAYQNEVYSFQPLAQYYTLDNNTTELVQNGYFSLPNMSGSFNSTGAPTGWNYVRVTTPQDGYQFTSGFNGVGVNTPVPTGAFQYIFLRDNGSNINQDIKFPCAGYYLLTYYASPRVGNSYSNNQIRVNIGTVVVDKIIPLVTNSWIKYNITFYVNAASTQNLKFQNYYPTYNGEGPLLVGISIVSASNNLRLANYATGVCSYDASLNIGTMISTNQYKTGAGCLSLDAKGQFTQLSSLITTNSGLSFSFWAKSNSKCGQNTLLDYSNGQGGNQRISLGIQNNNLLAQVVNGSSFSAPIFSPYSLVDTLSGTIKSIAIYIPANRIVYADYVANKIFVKNGTSSTYTPLAYTSTGLINYIDITSDGSRIVWCVATDYCYYATWDGTTYSNITTINPTFGTINIYRVDITDDGNTLAVFTADTSTGMLWSKWTGNGYSNYAKTTNIIKSNGIITPDGSKIAYLLNSNQLYYDTWDGGNYSNPVYVGTLYTSGSTTYTLAFSKDGNIIFSTSSNLTSSILQYTVWNGTGYGTITTTSVFSQPMGFIDLKVDYNNTIYALNFDYGYIYKTTYQIPNQYIATNFYTAQNLNDNTWRHYVWTIDPSNTTYRYYLNGSLIYTDNSSGYVFPAQATRTTNLLATSTDLPLSYLTGAIDNYRVYNGVLTSTQISSLYNYENTGTNTLLSYYPLDAMSYVETSVGNYTTGSYVYDATLIGGATITTKSNPPVGVKALNLDVSGQYVQLNTSFTTTTTGLSISLWFKGNNGCGQYTLLDYSNGPGGNNRISLGLQGNNLLGQVVNGTGLGSLTFMTAQTSSLLTATITAIAYSTASNRFIITDYTTGAIYFRTGFSGTDISFATGYANVVGAGILNDGSRGLWSIRNGNCYYATWNGTTYSNITTINTGAVTGIQGIDLTEDGTILVVAIGNVGGGSSGVPLWAYWTGSGYSTYKSILGATTSNYASIAITPDGSRIAFSDFTTNNVYYATWNGSNYSNTTLLTNTGVNCFCMKFSKDGNILFLITISGNALKYFIWNGSSFGSIQSVTVFNPIVTNPYGLCLDYNNIIYGCTYGISSLYKTTFSVSNQYIATNFFTSQNLNDGAWRHVAWTIDPSYNRYKYYLNGSLIKTDASLGYVFPSATTRTNNLLGVATDLSMSYFTGSINQYRVQTGVLTDAQVYALYTADAYNSQSIIQYYNFDTASRSGTSLGNYASGNYYVMDASLNGGAYISTSNTIVGTGSLSLDTSGQYVRINNNLSTSIGLSFSFWMRGNNSCGQYTLLDYSNGTGGNNRISLGLQNNTLFSQVTNGSNIGTVSFTTPTTTTASRISGLAYSTSVNRFVFGNYSTGYLYYRTGISGSDTLIGGPATANTVFDVCMTNDGNRIIWTVTLGLTYFATWNGSTNYTGIQQVNSDSTTRSFRSVDMTEDGSIMVVAVGAWAGTGSAGVPLWARWNGTNYSAYNTTLNSTSDNYTGIAITPDGSRIAYSTYGKSVYYAVWNGTNYSDRILIGSVLYDIGIKLKFSKDGNTLFVSSYQISGSFYGSLQYCIWNGTTYSSLINSGISVFSTVASALFGMAIDYNNNLYIGEYNQNTIYKTTFQVSNQYTQSNFYSAQNLNDNAWRHVAWTIDPTNTTYKYYLNGSLIKTDASSGYTFPGLTSRTNNLLGVSTDLSLSYFTGGIDNYRVYNGVLTDAQVYSLFTADAYNSQQLIQYYPCQTYSINTLLPTLTSSASLSKYYTFETTNMVSNGVFDSTILSVSTAYSSIVPLFWTVFGSNLLVNFLYLNGGTYQYPRGIVPTTINQWCDILTSSTQQNYIAQNIVFPNTGNYTLTCYVQGNSNNLYSTTISLGGNTLITVSATNVPSISTWTKLSASFYISSAPSTQQLKIMVPIWASTLELGITGISITPNTEYSINTVKDTALANMASKTAVYDTTLIGRPIDTTGNSKVGYNSLYVYGTGTTQTQYAQINNLVVTTAGLTVSCWFKFTSGTWSRVFQFGTTTDQAESFGFSAYNGSFVYVGTNPDTPQTGLNKNDNQWHHLVWSLTYATYGSNSSTHNVYLDGVNVYSSVSRFYPKVETKTTCYIGKGLYSGEAAAVGWVDDFRIYNGVLNATDAVSLYNNTSISYTYGLGNYTTGSYQYDASFNGGSTITTTDYKTGNSALTMDTPTFTIGSPSVGQFVRLNNNFVTSSIGLSFSLWFKARNSFGQNTLLDYSNGTGGNQRISLGLQNNTLLGQVVNGTTLSTAITFTTAQSASVPTTTFTGIAYSTSANRLIIADYGTGSIYYRTGFSGSNTAISGTYTSVIGICVTNDGSRLVWSVRNGNCYYAIWNGNTYSNITTINSGAIAGIQGIDMTDDGQIIFVAIGNVAGGSSGVPVWAYWTGSGYSTYKTILNTPTDNYVSCAITPDGSRIAYASFTTNKLYYAVWNGSNYTNASYTNNLVLFNNNSINQYDLSFNGTNQYASTSSATYYAYTSGTIEAWINTTANQASYHGITVKPNAYSLFLCDNKLSCYDWTTSTNYITSIALNDGVWHHVALTFQSGVTNGTKLYVDGLPVLTFTMTVYDQTYLLYIGSSVNIQYFAGNIDEVRIWSSVQSDTAIYQNYNKRISSTSTGLTGYWTMDEGTGTTLNNLVSGGYAMTLYNTPTWTTATEIANIGSPVFSMKFSKDGNILFLGTTSGNTLRYFIWNGTSFGSIQSNAVLNAMSVSPWGLCLDYNNTIYGCVYGVANIYKTTYQVPNQYTATNFYSAQNLNDNTWRHLAWTIDPSNTTYKYYLNGYLIKTDVSLGYTFPALTTRTNNLLGKSTDLSMSYFSGTIDNYCVYNGVLTDAQVYTLFTTDAYNSQQLIHYYTFDTTSAYGNTILSSGVYGYTNVSNLVSGSNVYDASLNGGARLNGTNYCVGNASLEITGSGQQFKMNNDLTTSGIGLSFVFWFRGSNSCGQYPLLDYSNGSGGNNKISLGLHNNTLYGQVINGSTISAPTFATGTTVSTGSGSAWPTEIGGFTMSQTTNRVVYTEYTAGNIYYRNGMTGTNVLIGTGYASIAGVAITYDGSRIVFCNRGGYCYFATWSTTSLNYTGITQINSGYGAKGFNSLDITGDGQIMVVGVGPIFSGQGVAQKPIWATWTGSGYSSFTDVSGASVLPYTSCAVTNDGSRMAYLDYTNNNMYYALWNGTTFVQASSGATVSCIKVYDVKFSRDGNILFILSQGTNPIQYCLWNGSSYGPIILTTAFSSINGNGLYVDNTNIYFGCWNTATVYGTTYTVPNQYLNTNFYTAQNLNDNQWRHLAWTIDPSNTTYKYYLNGSVIKTDISAGYAFPGLTTRKNNLLGSSTDLSLSYFVGGIDNYRVYNGVLTDDQISSLYKTDAYSNTLTTSTGGTLVQYYPCDSNKWKAQPTLSANYSLVHQYTFDYHTVNECMVLNTANYTPVYDCRLTNNSTSPTLDTADYKVGTSSLYFSANTLFLQINGVQIPANSGLSITCWFKYTSGQLFDFGNSGMDNLSYSPSTGITFKNGTTSYTINGGTGKADGTWHHFAWTISQQGSHNVYIDGTLSATTSSVYPVSGTRINNYIGKGVGRVDDFRIYSGVLSLTDVQNLNNLIVPTSSTATLLNYYTMDYNQIQNGFVPNIASGSVVYDAVLCNGTAAIPSVDISNNKLGNGSLYISGSNQYAQIKQVNVTNAGMTIAMWVKILVNPGVGWYRIIDFGNGTTNNYNNYAFWINNANTGGYVNIGSASNGPTTGTTPHTDGNWHHYVWTMTYSTTNTSTHVIYVDGVSAYTGSTFYYPTPGIRNNNRIGCSTINTDSMNGLIDDLRIYNGVMPASNVSALYNSTQYDRVIKIPNITNHYTFEPTLVGGNYVANMSSNTFTYDMVMGPGILPKLDDTAGNSRQGLRGLQLVGVNKQYVQLTNFSVPSSVGITIAGWFKYTSANWSRLFDFGNSIGTGNDNLAYSPNNGLYYAVGTTGYGTGTGSGKADGIWHHFAWSAVYAASGNTTHKIYIDGTPTTYTTWPYPTAGVRTYCYIGKSLFSADDYATGWVDDFRVYNGVLTDADVTGIIGSPTYSTSIAPVINYTFE